MKRIYCNRSLRNPSGLRQSQPNQSLRNPQGLWQSQPNKPLRRGLALWRSQPIRLITFTLLFIWLLPFCICHAAQDCSIEYTPRSERSAVFYIDVYSAREVTAAVFELRFADDMVGYYSVVADDSAATVRDRSEKGKTTFAYASEKPVSGKLCRVSFKALKEGSTDFTLHMAQAADADKKLLSDWSDHSLAVKLGKDDVEAAAAVSRTDGTSSGTAAAIRGAGGSELSNADDGDEESPPGLFDLRRSDSVLKWILIGAGIPLLIGGLVWLGILIGRRSKDKAKQNEEKPGNVLPEPDDPPAPEPTDEPDQNDSE